VHVFHVHRYGKCQTTTREEAIQALVEFQTFGHFVVVVVVVVAAVVAAVVVVVSHLHVLLEIFPERNNINFFKSFSLFSLIHSTLFFIDSKKTNVRVST
jgi:hypothetical protein